MTDEKRPYRKTRRAESEQDTRLRITRATMELHGTVGPSRTSISAIAKRAGVRRSTVYRHFPDEISLYQACSGHWFELHPMPEPSNWALITDPDKRLLLALRELYAFYHSSGRMLDNLLRDEPLMPVLKQVFSGHWSYLTTARDVLMEGRRNPPRKRQLIAAAIGHSLMFATWRSLVREQGFTDDQAAELMCCTVSAAANLVVKNCGAGRGR